jgi:hypothetical protein
MKRLIAIGAATGAALYVFDRQNGHRIRDRVLAFFRRTGREASRAGQSAKSQAAGLARKVEAKTPTR